MSDEATRAFHADFSSSPGSKEPICRAWGTRKRGRATGLVENHGAFVASGCAVGKWATTLVVSTAVFLTSPDEPLARADLAAA